MDPTFGVNHLGRLARFLVVADHDVAAADQQLAVLAQPHLDAGHRTADRRCLVVVHGYHGRGSRQLAHAPDLVQRHAQRGPELVHLRTARGRRRDGGRAPVEAHLRAQQHEQGLSAFDHRGELLRHGLALVAQTVGRDRRLDGSLHHLTLGLLGLGRDARPQTGHQLLPDAWDADEKRRPRLHEEWQQLVGVRAEPHFMPVRDPPPLRCEALGHVREGKVADERLRLDRPEALNGLERPDDVVV